MLFKHFHLSFCFARNRGSFEEDDDDDEDGLLKELGVSPINYNNKPKENNNKPKPR